MLYPFSKIKGDEVTHGQNKFPLIMDSNNNKLLKLKRVSNQNDLERFEVISSLDSYNKDLKASCKKFLASVKIFRVEPVEYMRPEVFFQYMLKKKDIPNTDQAT